MTGSAHEVHDDHDRTRFVLGHAGSTAALAYGNEDAEPGENWWWCYADELFFERPD